MQGDGAPPAAGAQAGRPRSTRTSSIFSPSGGTRYIALNTQRPPFDNVNVRKAVLAAIDRNALRLARGGAIIGPIAWSYLPPDFPGFKQSGGLKPPADIDYLQNDQGDLALAPEYMKKAGYADGKYKGDADLHAVATNADPGKKTAEVAQAQLEKLGFKVNVRFLPQNTLYTKFCGSGKSNYDVCPNVGFFKDFLDGASLIKPTFYGPAIIPQNNTNWPLLDDPKVNKLIETASTTQARRGARSGLGRREPRDHEDLAAGRPGRLGQPADHRVQGRRTVVADDYANSPFMAFLSPQVGDGRPNHDVRDVPPAPPPRRGGWPSPDDPPLNRHHGRLHHPPAAVDVRAADRRSASSRSSSSTSCPRPTRRCCARAAARAPSWSPSIRHTLGLDEPWYVQYWTYMKDVVLHFDFGYSYYNQVSGQGPDLRPPARRRSRSASAR